MAEQAINNLMPAAEDMAVEAMTAIIHSSYSHTILQVFKRPALNKLARTFVVPGMQDKQRLVDLNKSRPKGTSEISPSAFNRFSLRFREHLKNVRGKYAHSQLLTSLAEMDEGNVGPIAAFNRQRLAQLMAIELAGANTLDEIDTKRLRTIIGGVKQTHRMTIEDEAIVLQRDREAHRAAKLELEVQLLQQKFERAEKQFAEEAAARQAKNSDGKLTQDDIDAISAAVFGTPGGGGR